MGNIVWDKGFVKSLDKRKIREIFSRNNRKEIHRGGGKRK